MANQVEEFKQALVTEQPEEKDGKRFTIDNDGKAQWAFRKIREKQAQIAANKDIVKEAKEWAKTKNNALQKDVEYLKSLLLAYGSENLAKDPDYRFDSPLGKILLKKKPATWKHDEGKLIEQYKGTPFIETKLRWNDLKKNLQEVDGKVIDKETGEFVDGVSVTQGEKELTVQISHKGVK